jgi:predicted HNH restriction endonuclease
MRRNGEPYLEVHHIKGLAEGGPDHPLNVAAVCLNCHTRVTHGSDAAEYNTLILENVRVAETRLQSEAP